MFNKVLLYIDSLQLGGAERVMSNLAIFLYESGKNTILVNDAPSDPNKREYVVNQGIKRLYLNTEESRKNSFFEKVIKLRKVLINERPDVAISFLGPPNLRLIIASTGLRTKTIVSVRNDPNREYGTGFKKTITRWLFAHSDGCVFQTEEASKYFGDRTRKRAQIIFNPVNRVFFTQELLEEKKNIVVIGRLQKQKNPWMAINAFARIHNDFPDYRLQFYGDGELKNELIALSKKHDIESKVDFLGQVDNIYSVLASASLYLLTSDYEGMPNGLMEAMAVGVPCIITNCPCGGPASLIQNDAQGILIRVGNENDLVTNMIKILSSSSLRKSMRVASRLRAQDFRSEVVLAQWEKYIDDIFEEGKNR